MNHALIVAGGTGSRMGLGYNKVFAQLGSEPVLAHVIRAFERSANIDSITVVAGNPDAETVDADHGAVSEIAARAGFSKLRPSVAGGSTRMQSVENGLRALAPSDEDVILIQDGGRPFVSVELIDRVLEAADEFGAAVCGVRPKDSIQTISADGFVERTHQRSALLAVHTPAAAHWGLLREAREKARNEGYLDAPGYEDSALLALLGAKVKVVPSFYENIKITSPEDLVLAETLLNSREESC